MKLGVDKISRLTYENATTCRSLTATNCFPQQVDISTRQNAASFSQDVSHSNLHENSGFGPSGFLLVPVFTLGFLVRWLNLMTFVASEKDGRLFRACFATLYSQSPSLQHGFFPPWWHVTIAWTIKFDWSALKQVWAGNTRHVWVWSRQHSEHNRSEHYQVTVALSQRSTGSAVMSMYKTSCFICLNCGNNINVFTYGISLICLSFPCYRYLNLLQHKNVKMQPCISQILSVSLRLSLR